MQSEDLEESANPLEVASSMCEMTYSENTRDSTSPSNSTQQTPEDFKCPQLAISPREITKLDPEKMIPDSPNSSEEEAKSEDVRKVSSDTPENHNESSQTLKVIQDQHSNESIRSWLQRITQMQTEIQRKLNLEQSAVPHSHQFAEFPTKTCANNAFSQVAQTSNRVVKYQDLPYMGEMTLDNSKPRRGRKPKKADICHLIYKNYGTIYPGTPNPKSLVDRELNRKSAGGDSKSTRESPLPETFNRSDVQNRIISSLLEKRLTQESKRHKESLLASGKLLQKTSAVDHDQNEPLNLCIRDLNQLKIRLLRKHDNVYASEVKSEPQSDGEVEFVHETPSPCSSQNKELKVADACGALPMGDVAKAIENGVAPGGYVYWPNAGVFIHPMALQQHLMYYQKLAANNNYTLPSHSPKLSSESVHSPDLSTNELRKLAPKIKGRKPEPSDESEAHGNVDQKTKRNAPSSTERTPTKRKRSAIFIPPIPAENQTNPATEVSICKFKFTGGAKPSLQEKKMLSVDSGGNFRYYSGTGDKSMRGYEFFPRETLQQQIGNAQGSSTGAFLQASGEKIYPSPTADFPGKQDFMLTPEIQAPNLSAIPPDVGPRHKKRKSRKSLQREKLEQTFKEKGFLIQTQQLESAEGATYCKFRQLRKFTRYLFRSWKDYLPGNVTEASEEDRVNENDEVHDADLDNLLTLSNSELTSSDLQSSV